MKAKTKARTLPMSSFSITELMCFISTWRPPQTPLERRQSRWADWDSYLSDYRAVAEELAESGICAPDREPFAQRMAREFPLHADEIREAHRHKALQHSHWYRAGDGHVHADVLGGRLGPAVEITEPDATAITLTTARVPAGLRIRGRPMM